MASTSPSEKAVSDAAARTIFANPNGFGFSTEGLTVASTLTSRINRKNILITGVAEGSIGAEAAFSIASASPNLIILSARSQARAQPVAAKIASTYPNVKVEILDMDLGSLASIRAAAQKLNTKLDVLINNAGVMAVPYGTTTEGFEMQFGVNHLGHFLFTVLLLKEGKIEDGGRIVNVSSDGHRLGNVRFKDTNFENGKIYNAWQAYGQSKTANLLFSLELANRLRTKSIQSYSLHPGVILGTNLGAHLNPDLLAALKAQDKLMGFSDWALRFKNIQGGCATHLVAAFDPSISEYNGGYLEDCAIFKPLHAYAADKEAAKKLWALSEDLVGERF